MQQTSNIRHMWVISHSICMQFVTTFTSDVWFKKSNSTPSSNSAKHG